MWLLRGDGCWCSQLLWLFTLLVGLLAFAPPLLATNPQSVEFEHLTIDDGLSHSVVWDVQQDRRGFLWFATAGLLQRYDGYEFTSFQHDPDDPDSVSAGKIMKIFEDRHGLLWLATRSDGVDRFDPLNQRFTHFRPDPDDPRRLSDGRVRVIYEDPSGTLWVGSYGGLHRFHPEDGSFTTYRHDPSDPTSIGHGLVTAILADRHGVLWIGSGGGLNRFEPSTETFVHYRHDPEDPKSLSHDGINEIYEDASGELWVGTSHGLVRFDRTDSSFVRYALASERASESSGVVELLEDIDGELWVGTYGAGVFRTDRSATDRVANQGDGRERFIHFRHDSESRTSLGSDRVHAFWEDRSGLLWIGHRDGLDTYDRQRERFVKYRLGDSGLAGSKVWGITEDRSGVLWISSHNGGLTAFDLQKPKRSAIAHYRHQPGDPESLLSSRTTAILEDRHGELWVGHLQGGLSRMDRQRRRVTRYAPDPDNPASLAPGTVAGLLEDRSGAIWAGMLGGGVQRFDRERDAFTAAYEHDPEDPSSLRSNDAYVLYEDRAGELWIGTYGGLSRFEPDARGFVHHTHDPENRNSLSGNNVTSLHEDADGIFWVGTAGSGLNRWDRGRDEFRHYRVKDGLPSDTVVGIVEDDRQRLWLATDQGLARLDPRSGLVRGYDTDDGLHGNVFFIGPAHRTREGELFFGGNGGVTAFFPDRIEDDPMGPEVAVTDFLIDGTPVPLRRLEPGSPLEKPITETSELVLTHRHRTFSLQFAGLHFASPGKSRYAFRLQGYDRDWIETDARHRRARYTNLDPGEYRFQVRASNRDDVWNNDGAAIRIRVLPPPWRSWWAYSLYLLGLTVAVVTYLRGQRRKLERERQTAERERASAERERAASRRLLEADKLKDEFLANTSHELRTPLYGITGLAESLIDGAGGELPEAANSSLEMLVASGRRLTSLVNDILDLSKLKHHGIELDRKPVDLHALIEVVLVLSRAQVKSKELRLINSVPTGLPAADADEDRLQQILHNLVGNALKFTEFGVVEVGAELVDNRLVVRVADTGIGIADRQQERIFRAFEQADASTERQHGGTGLGLSITRKLVELHGGRLWLESTPGQGSTFLFTLSPSGEAAPEASREPKAISRLADPPVADQAVGAQASGEQVTSESVPGTASVAASATEGSAEILIVDDEPIIRQVLVNQLATTGYRLHQATSGSEALARAEEKLPDLILLDVMMPRMSGYEVCRALRERHTLDELPVIFLTAKSQPSDLVVGLAAGANDYLAKPISKSELLARVKTHLDLLGVHRQLSLLVDERSSQLRERERLLTERERLIGELESRNAELARFNYTIAHDLKNPLTTIKNFVGLVARDAEAGDLDRLHKDLRRVDKAADRLQVLLEDLHEFSRVERDQGEGVELPFGKLFEDVVDDLADVIATRGVEVEVKSELPVVCGNRDRLRVVARQLLNNAVSYLGDQPSPRIEIGAREGKTGPIVYVQDNGIGIERRYHERIFGLFDRLDQESSEGTGIGLALVKRIVEVHGGKVWVESEGLGKGSTFCLALPVPQRFR